MTGGAITAKSRAILGEMLTAGDYNALIHKTEVGAVITYLKGTERYKNALALISEGTVRRRQAEELLGKFVFESYERLGSFAPTQKNGFNSFYVKYGVMREVHEAVHKINIGKYDEITTGIPSYLCPYATFDLLALGNCRSFNDIQKLTKGTWLSAALMKSLPTDGKKMTVSELNRCSTELHSAYTSWLVSTAEKEFSGSEKEELLKMLGRENELNKLLMAYRLKSRFNLSADEAMTILPSGRFRLASTELRSMLSDGKGTERLEGYITKNYFGESIALDHEMPEIAIREYNRKTYLKRLRMTSSGSVALYSTVKLLDGERENLTTVIEGIRYSVPPDNIKKLLAI